MGSRGRSSEISRGTQVRARRAARSPRGKATVGGGTRGKAQVPPAGSEGSRLEASHPTKLPPAARPQRPTENGAVVQPGIRQTQRGRWDPARRCRSHTRHLATPPPPWQPSCCSHRPSPAHRQRGAPCPPGACAGPPARGGAEPQRPPLCDTELVRGKLKRSAGSSGLQRLWGKGEMFLAHS